MACQGSALAASSSAPQSAAFADLLTSSLEHPGDDDRDGQDDKWRGSRDNHNPDTGMDGECNDDGHGSADAEAARERRDRTRRVGILAHSRIDDRSA